MTMPAHSFACGDARAPQTSSAGRKQEAAALGCSGARPHAPREASAVLRGLRPACLVFALASAGGCAIRPIEPWVKPYERERLADPIMKLGTDELAAKQFDHIYTVREGARGATGVQGGGCGCN
jgi:hypothetical protein